jgi:polysaccharide export outer membrane protein
MQNRIWNRAAGQQGRLVGFLSPFAIAILLLAGDPLSGAAQTPSASQIQQLQQQYQQRSSGGSASPEAAVPQDVIIQPALQEQRQPLAPSRLEQIMSARAGARLQQFGYDQLGSGRAVTVPQTGAMQDDYILGPGDEVVVSLRGQENSEFRQMVDRNGQVNLPRLNPISATGRSFGSFREDVESAVKRAYVATNAFVSVGRVRQINVLVSGEVNSPGQRLVTGLSSAVDALLLSGGVKKTGSLRNVRIQRGDHSYAVDLYGILTSRGGSSNFRLADGDRILVPPLGKTVAVTGLVRQPGIYELAAGQSSMPVRSLLALAGGQEVRGRYRISALRVLPDGQSRMEALPNEGGAVRDSEILFVQLGADQTGGQATLSGGTGLAGSYAVSTGAMLSDVIRAPGALGPSPYTLFGIISRRNPRNLMRELVPFTPVAILSGAENSALQPEDVVRPISVNEAQLLTNAVCTYLANQQNAQEALRNPTARDISDFGSQPNKNNSTNSSSNNGSNTNTNTASNTGSSDNTNATDITHGESYLGCSQNEGGARVFASQTQTGQINNVVQRPIVDQFGDTLPQYYLPQPQTVAQQQALNNPNNPQQLPPVNGFATGGPAEASAPPSDLPQPAPFAFPADQMRGPQAPAALNYQEQPLRPGQFAGNREVRRFADLAQQLGVTEVVLINFLIDHQVQLSGAIRGPGRYFVGPSVVLPDLVQAAGGTINWADASAVEVISTAVDTGSGRAATSRATLSRGAGTYASYVVRPQDVFRFNQVFADNDNGTVTVQGEVRFTGSFQIRRGEHLSELLQRAGGLTSTAYPYGTVFLRKSVANMEHESFLRAAKETEDQLIVAMTRVGSDKVSPDTFSAMQGFITDLRNQKAVGRISIVADPSVLAAKPDLDPLLEPGDVIYIPQRSGTISVLGQVRQPGSYPYQAHMSIWDYIARAGGYSPTAEESGAYIVLPDGSARKIERSWLNFDTDSMPPGSAIVVPRDVTPLDLRQIIIDTSQIFSQLAVSIASVAVISR